MRTLVIGTAGHIDHGKSALVRAVTGIDPDRLKEEQERGITIDLGFAHYRQNHETVFSFVDVPGHERFVKNMLAGISGIHAVLLVVAADESVMPQTREHFDICKLLHIETGVIALTKCDLVDEEMIELAGLEVRELVAGSFLSKAPIIPVSAHTGSGIPALCSALGDLTTKVSNTTTGTAVRLPIDRVFSVKGFGTVVTGTLVTGEISMGTDLELLPSDRKIKVRGIQVHSEKETLVKAGQRVALNLGGLDLSDVTRGDALTQPSCFDLTRRIDAVLELLPSAKPLRQGTRIRFHHGTSETLGRVTVVGSTSRIDTFTNDAKRPSKSTAQVMPGARAYVRLNLEAPTVLTRGDRYILRAYSPSVTIAGGVVLDPQVPRSAVRTESAWKRFQRLDPLYQDSAKKEKLDEAILVMLEEKGVVGLNAKTLVSRAGVSPDTVETVMLGLVSFGHAVRVAEAVVSTAVLKGLKQQLSEILKEFHLSEPLSDGLPREEARERLFGKRKLPLFDLLLSELVEEGSIIAKDRLALADHHVSLSFDESKAQSAIEQAYFNAGLKPPDRGSLHSITKLDEEATDRIVDLMIRKKVLIKVESLLFHALNLERLKKEVKALKHGRSDNLQDEIKLDVTTFKERYDITRKFAIPLLGYLDRERITRRVGDLRIVI